MEETKNFEREEMRGSARAERETTCCIFAVTHSRNDILRAPFITNYKLVPKIKKKKKNVEVHERLKR